MPCPTPFPSRRLPIPLREAVPSYSTLSPILFRKTPHSPQGREPAPSHHAQPSPNPLREAVPSHPIHSPGSSPLREISYSISQGGSPLTLLPAPFPSEKLSQHIVPPHPRSIPCLTYSEKNSPFPWKNALGPNPIPLRKIASSPS